MLPGLFNASHLCAHSSFGTETQQLPLGPSIENRGTGTILAMKYIIPFLVTHLLATTVDARWAEPVDASMAVNFETTHIKVKKDGTYVLDFQRQVEILKESARTEQGLQRINIADTSTFELIEAKTINGKRNFPVHKQDVEFKPLASSGPGFDRQKQVTIAFPEVSVGSKLFLKYRKRVPKVEIPGLFFRHFPLGWNEYLQNWTLKIDSEVALFHETYDPGPAGKKLIRAEATEKSVTFTLIEPFYRSIWEEEGASMDPLSVIWIGVTSAKSWAEMPKATIHAYESTMASPLPEKFKTILVRAQDQQGDIAKINTVTSLVAENVRYVGDWRLVRGAFHPRSLEKIASTGYGDCKDFSVSTGSILKALGFEVHAAWVARGKDWVVSPLKIAAPNFNHAILFARKDGRDYWLDPTNTTSFAQGTYSDIANHPSVVLIPGGHSELLKVPQLRAENGTIDTRLKLAFNGADSVKAQGEFSLLGHAAVSMTAAELSSTKKTLDYTFVRWLVNTANLESWDVGDYNLKSRIVEDIKSTFKYQEQWRPITTTAGNGYLVPISYYAHLLRVRMGPDRVSSLKLDDPVTWRREYRFNGRDAVFAKDVACQGTSLWADFNRELKRDAKDALLIDTVKLKVSVIPNTELHTDEFSKFQASIIACMQEAVIVFK
jgi:hypothetical protein